MATKLSTTFPPTPDRSCTTTPTSTAKPSTQDTFTPPNGQLLASSLTITKTTTAFPVPTPNSPQLHSQRCHTDHILSAIWNISTGWSAPTIKPYSPLLLSPMSSVLHYATSCFEGMKAYRGVDGHVRLFRPELNCKRMLKSATRIALPGFDPKELEGLIEKFVGLEAPRWIPDSVTEKGRRGAVLYLRPTLVGTGDVIGVQRPTEAMLFVVAVCFPGLDRGLGQIQTQDQQQQKIPPSLTPSLSPAPSPPVQNGMRLLASPHDAIRAWPGGFGNAKVGANYGPSLVAQGEAREKGYEQILWLFGPEGYVTEAGASNFFVVWRDQLSGRVQLVTAPLGDGVILDGVTRRSVLQIVGEMWGDGAGEEEVVEVVERRFTMDEVVAAADQGRLVEAFACGTAFFVAPIQEIHFRGRDVEFPLKRVGTQQGGGRYAMQIKERLRDIMNGTVEHEWGHVVEEMKEQL